MAEAYAKRKGEAVGGCVSRGRSSSFEVCPLPLIKGGSHPDGVMTSSHLAT